MSLGNGSFGDYSLCTLVYTNMRVATSPTPIAVSSKTSLLTTLGLESRSFVCFTLLLAFFHHVFRASLVSQGLFQLELRIQLNLSHHVKIPQLRPNNILLFPGRHPLPCSNGFDSTSNAVACHVVRCCSCGLPF